MLFWPLKCVFFSAIVTILCYLFNSVIFWVLIFSHISFTYVYNIVYTTLYVLFFCYNCILIFLASPVILTQSLPWCLEHRWWWIALFSDGDSQRVKVIYLREMYNFFSGSVNGIFHVGFHASYSYSRVLTAHNFSVLIQDVL